MGQLEGGGRTVIGSIRRRGKDRWTVVVDAGPDPGTGKRRQVRRTVRGTKREAEELLVSLIDRRDRGLEIAETTMTVAQYLRWWLEQTLPELAPATRTRYRDLVRSHLVPALGGHRLAKLRPFHVQGAYRSMLEGDVDAQTVLAAHGVLQEAIALALRWDLVGRNVVDQVAPPRVAPDATGGQIVHLVDVRRGIAGDDGRGRAS